MCETKLNLPIRRRRSTAAFEQRRIRTERRRGSARLACIEPRQAFARAAAIEAPFARLGVGGTRAAPDKFARIDIELNDHFRETARLPFDLPEHGPVHRMLSSAYYFQYAKPGKHGSRAAVLMQVKWGGALSSRWGGLENVGK